MSKKVENDIRMAQAVHEVLDNNENTWQKVKGFVNEVEESRDLMELLKATRVSVQKKSKGTTEDKANLQEAAIVIGADLANRACVYLRKNKLMEMYEQVHVTKTDLRLMPDNDLVAKLQNIHKELSAVVDKLADYNVYKENLETLKKAIVAFDDMVPKPRGVQLKVQRDNHTIAELIELLKVSFVNMDDLMSNFRGSNFAIEFENSRKIIERGSRHGKPPGEKEEKKDDKDEEKKEGADK